MKIKKPEDEKYFKDIVLNSILDEISSETHIANSIQNNQKELPRTTEPTEKKSIFKRVFFALVSIIFLAFVLFLVNLIQEAVNDNTPADLAIEKNTTSTKEHTTIQEDRTKTYHQTQTVKHTIPSKPLTKKLPSKKEPVKKEELSAQIIEFKVIHPPSSAKPKNDRERAKEALKKQMLQ